MTTAPHDGEQANEPSPFPLTLAAALVAIAITLSVRGLVVMKLWAWFVVESFTDAPRLGWLDAAGLTLVASAITRRVSSTDKEEPLQSPARVIRGAVIGAFVLVIGGLGAGALVAAAR